MKIYLPPGYLIILTSILSFTSYTPVISVIIMTFILVMVIVTPNATTIYGNSCYPKKHPSIFNSIGLIGPGAVLDDLLEFFSKQLTGVLPAIHTSNDYFLETSDTLVAATDMDGKIYVVPFSTNLAIDSV